MYKYMTRLSDLSLHMSRRPWGTETLGGRVRIFLLNPSGRCPSSALTAPVEHGAFFEGLNSSSILVRFYVGFIENK